MQVVALLQNDVREPEQKGRRDEDGRHQHCGRRGSKFLNGPEGAVEVAAPMARAMTGRSMSGSDDRTTDTGRISRLPSARRAKAPGPEKKVTK